MNSRRSFISRLGIGASGALAATVGLAKAEAPKSDSAAQRVAQLEAEKAVRQLHKAFERAMGRGAHDEVIGMFSADAEVVFNGGVFTNKAGLARLYRERFAAGKSGGWLEPAPGFELAVDQQKDCVEVATDLKSAKAAFTYSIQVGVPFETESSLAAMARLHGEGVRTWWEGGVYKVDYREGAAGDWKISRLEYDVLSRADWRAGKRYAQPIEVARFATRFPENPLGPDRLV